MIPKRRKREPLGLRQAPQIRCPAHLAWVRGHECAIAGKHGITGPHECAGSIEAAHVRTGTDGATSIKPSDIWAIPLCSSAHRLQHQLGESAFEQRFGIDMRRTAQILARLSPHRRKWETT